MDARNWIANHHRVVCVFVLALAALNAWISYTLFPHHPHLALLHAAPAAILVLGVVLTWWAPSAAGPRKVAFHWVNLGQITCAGPA